MFLPYIEPDQNSLSKLPVLLHAFFWVYIQNHNVVGGSRKTVRSSRIRDRPKFVHHKHTHTHTHTHTQSHTHTIQLFHQPVMVYPCFFNVSTNVWKAPGAPLAITCPNR